MPRQKTRCPTCGWLGQHKPSCTTKSTHGGRRGPEGGIIIIATVSKAYHARWVALLGEGTPKAAMERLIDGAATNS